MFLWNISTQYFVFWTNWPFWLIFLGKGEKNKEFVLFFFFYINLITLTRAPNSGVSGTGTTNENTQSLSAGPGDSIDTWRHNLCILINCSISISDKSDKSEPRWDPFGILKSRWKKKKGNQIKWKLENLKDLKTCKADLNIVLILIEFILKLETHTNYNDYCEDGLCCYEKLLPTFYWCFVLNFFKIFFKFFLSKRNRFRELYDCLFMQFFSSRKN